MPLSFFFYLPFRTENNTRKKTSNFADCFLTLAFQGRNKQKKTSNFSFPDFFPALLPFSASVSVRQESKKLQRSLLRYKGFYVSLEKSIHQHKDGKENVLGMKETFDDKSEERRIKSYRKSETIRMQHRLRSTVQGYG